MPGDEELDGGIGLDGTLYFTVRFTDQTSFCVRYACDMFPVGIELSDWQSGDFHIIREYMKPIPM